MPLNILETIEQARNTGGVATTDISVTAFGSQGTERYENLKKILSEEILQTALQGYKMEIMTTSAVIQRDGLSLLNNTFSNIWITEGSTDTFDMLRIKIGRDLSY